MNKELLEKIDSMIERIALIELHTGETESVLIDKHTLLDIQKELELKSINNTKPSEAIECLEKFFNSRKIYEPNNTFISDCIICLNSIKQELIKSQEQEKENAYIEKIKTMMKQKDCVLRYIESEDCFAVKTILSDGWYKLTPEFVENNVREEIKPLPLIEKNKQLKEENAELKKVLEAIKKHFIIKFEEDDVKGDVWGRLISIQSKEDEGDWDTTACANIVDYKEDFELLKRYLGNE